jgi:lipoprotein-anchoring transpeptidase ErfK/SrfK
VDLTAGKSSSALNSMKIVLSAPAKVTAGGTLTVKAGFETSVEATVSAQWYQNGKALEGYSNDSFALTADATSSYSPTIVFTENMEKSITVGFSITYTANGAYKVIYEEVTVPIENYSAEYYNKLKTDPERINKLVTSYPYQVTVKANCSIYKNSSLKGWVRVVNAGTTATCIYRNGTYASKIRLSDGTEGWISYSNLTFGTGNYTRATDYTTSEKETWINYNGYSSETQYLIWISHATQKVNVFQGSKGSWKLIKTFSCSTGKSTTPTPLGVYTISYKLAKWDFTYYWCGPVTGFYGGYAFHSWLHTPSGGQYDYTLGRPVSHGCIRMEDSAAQYIYTLPFNTTVVSY